MFYFNNVNAALDNLQHGLEIGHTTVSNRSGIMHFEDGILTFDIGHCMSTAGNWYYIVSCEWKGGRRVFSVNEWEPEYDRIFDMIVDLSL